MGFETLNIALKGILEYDEFEDDPGFKASEYEARLQELEESGRENPILKAFLEASLEMFYGDSSFIKNDLEKSLEKFQNASTLFSRFIRHKGEANEILVKEASRRQFYSTGKFNEIEARLVEHEDSERCSNELLEAVKAFEEEEKIAKEIGNITAWSNSKVRKNVAKARAYEILSKNFLGKEDLNKALKMLLQAIRAYNRGGFLRPEFREKGEDLKREVRELIKLRLKTFIKSKAEKYWMEGIKAQDEGHFEEAVEKFKTARKVHVRLLEIATEKERELMTVDGLLYAACEKEALAYYYMRSLQDPNTASIPFKEAAQIIDEAQNISKKTGVEKIIEYFEAQKEFYFGMSVHCKGLGEFDGKNYKIAEQLFAIAEENFRGAEETAKKIGNETLVKIANSMMMETQGYRVISVTMAKTIIE
ncbi:MAG: hypothetical protein ACFE68_06340 [Candidatus Hodarchaeota archaeon]